MTYKQTVYYLYVCSIGTKKRIAHRSLHIFTQERREYKVSLCKRDWYQNCHGLKPEPAAAQDWMLHTHIYKHCGGREGGGGGGGGGGPDTPGPGGKGTWTRGGVGIPIGSAGCHGCWGYCCCCCREGGGVGCAWLSWGGEGERMTLLRWPAETPGSGMIPEALLCMPVQQQKHNTNSLINKAV